MTSATQSESVSKRDQILDAAQEAFATKGFRGAPMAAIATTAGLTQQGLLHYFATKTHLLLAVLERRQDSDVENFWDFQGSYLDALIELTSENAQRPGLIRLFATLSAEGVDPENPGHAWWTDRYAMMRSLVVEALRRDQAAGVLRADLDLAVTAVQIIAVMDGLQLQWLLHPQEIDMVKAMESFLQTLRAS
ncbi:TetR family transcriptional regulator [Jatrophihabitans sp. GAS493]|uniref:TetR/AcrR family transcriptional regulator n=1 Tax=Jatrophihabitans sp. GAS493 TaxID=1907575 RepID=UPI000BB88BF9|nr:TetR/AcrR family transcriptional regulator [Jatrophihabitans sp. GAS493]SOD74576.1 TetR family transcriptional regulator [Jatrophihabitans sp. GAS493]